MSGRPKLLLFLLLAMLLMATGTGCVGAFGGNEVQAVDGETIMRTMNFVEGPKVGEPYTVSMTVPSDWVGDFQTRNVGNALYFDYTGGAAAAPIFFIEALSEDQYWRQVAYPGSYVNIKNSGDTYFIYHLPIDSFYSGLDPEAFAELTAMVPNIVETVVVE